MNSIFLLIFLIVLQYGEALVCYSCKNELCGDPYDGTELATEICEPGEYCWWEQHTLCSSKPEKRGCSVSGIIDAENDVEAKKYTCSYNLCNGNTPDLIIFRSSSDSLTTHISSYATFVISLISSSLFFDLSM